MLFLARHLRELADRLGRAGHKVAPLDLEVGSGPVDRFVDAPPYPWDRAPQPGWNQGTIHLKLALAGFATTSFGIVVEKGRGPGETGRGA